MLMPFVMSPLTHIADLGDELPFRSKAPVGLHMGLMLRRVTGFAGFAGAVDGHIRVVGRKAQIAGQGITEFQLTPVRLLAALVKGAVELLVVTAVKNDVFGIVVEKIDAILELR